MQLVSGAGPVIFLSAGGLPNSQGEQRCTTKKKILKVKVGAVECVPKELKHLDSPKQISKHK